jgi:hypothetical protein
MTITIVSLGLAVIVVCYAVYAFLNSKTPSYMQSKSSHEGKELGAQKAPDTEEKQQGQTGAQPEKKEPTAEHPLSVQAETTAEEEPKITQFRNPKTGETAANPTNYRFAKKWIKQAMVDEGLLDRVYKNKELKGTTERKVKDALNRFKQLDRYHG